MRFNYFKVGMVDVLFFVAVGLLFGWGIACLVSGALLVVCLLGDGAP